MPDRRTPVRPQRIRRAKRPDPKARAARTWRKRIGWGAAVLGLVLFLTGSLGARLGVVLLPFDQHHVIGQFGGIVLALVGVSIATRGR
ncbi:MAG: hypothetical protein ACRDUY_14225 [Nitriliruptorales bacterium]